MSNELKPQANNLAGLYEEYGRVIRMCEGTKVSPTICWCVSGYKFNSHPGFNGPPETYEFAIAIVEDKPVWRGSSELYRKDNGEYVVPSAEWASTDLCSVYCGGKNININNLTWTPPNPNAKWKKLFEEGERVQCRSLGQDGGWYECEKLDFANFTLEFQLAPKTITIEGEVLALSDKNANPYCKLIIGDFSYKFSKHEDVDKWYASIDKWVKGEK